MFNSIGFELWVACWQTIVMVFVSCLATILIGVPLGMLLYMTRLGGISSNLLLNRLIGSVVNVVRSVPFIILMVAVIPFTRFVVGTSIGTAAAIVPLSLAAIPFFARLVENALMEVPEGVIEATQSMGANHTQILWRVLLHESWPSIVRALTLTLIALVGYSAMAGVVGGGGLGNLAIQYGYQRFDITVMVTTVVLLVVLVQLIQMCGDAIANALTRN